MRIDDDAVLWSASEADRAGRPLLVLLHGYNSNEGDLFGLTPYLPLEPAVASVRAPLHTGYGYAWFPLDTKLGHSLSEADAATDALVDWFDRVLGEPGTATGRVAGERAASVGLIGFSQGGAMVLELMRRQPERFAFGVCLAGFAIEGDREGDARLAEVAPPVFWGRGTNDEIIPEAAIARTAEWLPTHASLDARIYEGLGHSVSERELADVSAFVQANLPAAR